MSAAAFTSREGLRAVVYLLLSVTFAFVLFGAMDEHYDYLVGERFDLAGADDFTSSRILSILALKVVAAAGFSPVAASKVLLVLSAVGVLFAFRSLLVSSAGVTPSRASLLSPAILVPMTWNYVILSNVVYPEDIPALLLFILGLSYLFDGRMARFHAVFMLAVLNRESAVFLVPAMFLVQLGRRDLRALVLHCLGLGAAWFAARMLLMHFFGGGMDAPMYLKTLDENLEFCRSILRLNPRAVRMLMVFGGAWIALPFCGGGGSRGAASPGADAPRVPGGDGIRGKPRQRGQDLHRDDPRRHRPRGPAHRPEVHPA